MGMNKLWRTALLSASRSLRKNVLRGRIWGIGSPTHNDDDSQNHIFGEPGDFEFDDTAPAFPSALYSSSSSSSSVDLQTSASLPSLSALERLQRSPGKYRNGRVKGMVQNYEQTRSRSGSEASDVGEFGEKKRRLRAGSGSNVGADDASGEPTMESLLGGDRSDGGSWGARAWEEDVTIGETVKRSAPQPPVPGEGAVNGHNIGDAEELELQSDAQRERVDTARSGSWRSGRKGKGKRERPRVSAIFTGNNVEEGVSLRDEFGPRPVQEDLPEEQEDARLALEETRALVLAFGRRLEEVERRVREMEEEREKEEEERGKRSAVIKSGEVETGKNEDNRAHPTLLSRSFGLLSRIIHSFVSMRSTPSPDTSPPAPETDADTNTNTGLERMKGALHRTLFPTRFSELPSYMLLVSIGMCAVVLRVVIRRTIEKRRGWRG